MTVADVAFAVGFNDRKYFSREFRKQYELSPSKFIEANLSLGVMQILDVYRIILSVNY